MIIWISKSISFLTGFKNLGTSASSDFYKKLWKRNKAFVFNFCQHDFHLSLLSATDTTREHALSIMAYTMHVIFPTDRFSLAGVTTVTKVLLGIMLLILWTQYIIYGDRRNSQFRNKGQYSSTNQETDIIYLNIKRWWTFLLFRNGEIWVKIRTEEHEYSVTQSINW